MSAAHETPTLEPSQERVCLVFGGLTVSATAHTSYVERAAGGSVVGAATLTDQPLRLLITRAGLLAQQQYGKRRKVCPHHNSPSCRRQSGRNGSKRTATTFGEGKGGEPVAPVV